MNGTKRFYQSKIFWVGIIQLVYGAGSSIALFIETADYSPTSIMALISGILLIIFRIWFTEYSIEV